MEFELGSIAVKSFAIAIGLAALVSLDVCGLLLSQRRLYAKRHRTTGQAVKVAAMHGGIHAGLFALYFLVLNFAILLPTYIVDLIKYIFSFSIPVDVSEVSRTSLLISSVLIVIFVWITYSTKIIENHKNKTDSKEIESMRVDAKILYAVISQKIDSNYRKFQLAMAFMVAIDMLAITSFIRVFFEITADLDNQNGSQDAPHFNFGISFQDSRFDPWIDPIVFALLVFIFVSLLALLSVKFGIFLSEREGRKNSEPHRSGSIDYGLMAIRITEPFLVFFCLAWAIDHLFGANITSAYSVVFKILTSALLSAALTSMLILYNGWGNIWQSVVSGSGIEYPDKMEEWENNFSVAKFAGWILFILIATVGMLWWSHPKGIEIGDGAGRFLKVLTLVVGAVSFVALYLPVKKSVAWEERLTKKYFDQGPQEFRIISFCFGVYAVLLGYLYFSGGLNFQFSGDRLGFGSFALIEIFRVSLLTITILFLRSRKLDLGKERLNLAEWFAAAALAILVLDAPHLWHAALG